MSNAYETLIRKMLPERILEYFELTDVKQSQSGQLNLYLEEKNLAPAGYEKPQLESKVFYQKQQFRTFQSVVIK